MSSRAIFATDAARGWRPWGVIVPILGLVLIIVPTAGMSLLLVRVDLLESDVGPIGLVALLDETLRGVESASGRAANVATALRQTAPEADAYDNSFDASYGNVCADAEFPDTFPGMKARAGDSGLHSTGATRIGRAAEV